MTPDQEAIDALAEALAEWDGGWKAMAGWNISRPSVKVTYESKADWMAIRLRSRGFDIVRKE
jgi:hypothetical protein